MAEKLKFSTPYGYALNNPIKFIDYNGLIPRIYIETQGLGHTFVTVGSGKNTVVYTYGRYAELGKDKPSFRSTTPTGEGVLIRLSGKEAKTFIKDQMINKEAKAFEITSADDKKVATYFDKQFNTSDKIPTTGDYQDNPNARVVDTYSLLDNNCTTKSTEAVEQGSNGQFDVSTELQTEVGSIQSEPKSPAALMEKLETRARNKNSGIKEVKYEEVKKELNLPNGASGEW